jgi:hypothetical protein
MTAIDAEIHKLFRELLAPGRLKKGVQKNVRSIYKMLLDDQFLLPDNDHDDDDDDGDEYPGAPDSAGRRSSGQNPSWSDFGLPDEHESAAAAEPRDEKLAQALRATFRRLARALHPDTVQDPSEQLRRTAAMKEVTQAYQDRDLARLMDLEQTWLKGENIAAPTNANETEERCAALQASIAALKAQLKALERDLRSLRKSAPVQAMKGFEQAHKGGLVEEAAADIERHRKTRDLVRDFRDGKATLAELMRGPELSDDDIADMMAADEEFEDLLTEFMAELNKAGAPKRKQKAPSKRK